MTLTLNAFGLDNANSFDYGLARADGASFALRYSAGAGNNQSATQWKLCKPGEIAEIEAAGLVFIANSEWYETRVTEGAAAGAADGAADLAFWKSRGYGQGKPIVVSWDAAPNSGQFDQVVAYLVAYANALQGYYTLGLYAGTPAIVYISQRVALVIGWVTESASWSCSKQPLSALGISAPPAVTNWDLWFPTKSQIAPASKYILGLLNGHQCKTIIWQDGNKWPAVGGSDENIVIATEGSDAGQGGGTPLPPPPAPPAPTVVKAWQGYPVPALIAHGSGQYLGSISGPAASHGGYNPSEKAIVKVLQQRLIACGFVPGVSDPNSGWADGIFDTPADRPGTGATSQAVRRFHDAWYPNQPQPTQVWDDDWRILFNHS